MASELTVQTIQGPASGANANKIIVPSGQTLDVSSGSFTPAIGQIVQVVEGRIPGTGTSTSTSYVSDGPQVSITPTSVNNYIIAIAHSSSSIAGGWGYFKIQETTTNTSVVEIPWGNFSNSPQWLMGLSMVGKFQPTSTSTLTFDIYGKCTAGTRYIHYTTTGMLTLMEIAQ